MVPGLDPEASPPVQRSVKETQAEIYLLEIRTRLELSTVHEVGGDHEITRQNSQ